jgi:hypothetical protein
MFKPQDFSAFFRRFPLLWGITLSAFALTDCGGGGSQIVPSTQQQPMAISQLQPTAKPTSVPASTGSTGLLIPLYLYPADSTSWAPVISAKQAYPNKTIVGIINRNSGPGSAYDPTYGAAVARIKAVGITTMGYILTYYGSASVASVEAQMLQWKQWYSPSGIFLDNMAYVSGYESYYTTLTQYAKSIGFTKVFGNPGIDTVPSYVGTVDTIQISENSGYPSVSFVDGWHASYPKSNFAFTAYAVPTLNKSLEEREERYVGYEYITSRFEPNPYDQFPSYLTAELGAL